MGSAHRRHDGRAVAHARGGHELDKGFAVSLRTTTIILLLVLLSTATDTSAQFTLRDSSRADIGASFTVTTFATGLNWPLGMVLLDDGSILVSIVEGTCLDRLDGRRRADGSQQVYRKVRSSK